MIKGTGIDIVEVGRIDRLLEKGKLFTDKVFSQIESDYCQQQGVPSQSYAGKFAAKEAFLKAIGTGWRGEIALNEIQTINDELGKPHLEIIGKSKEVIPDLDIAILHVSISHTDQYAVAMVIIESYEPEKYN